MHLEPSALWSGSVATITVHHLEHSRSTRVLWLLEELGLEYSMKEYARNPKTMRAPPELKKVHPLGKAPVVEIEGDMLAESGAILEGVMARFGDGGLIPADEGPARTQYRYWLHYAEGSLMSPLLVKLIFDQLRKAPMPFFIKPIAKGIAGKVEEAFTHPELQRHFDFVDGYLGDNEFFAGDAFSAADIQMSYPLEAASERAGSAYPQGNIKKWLARVQQRPAYVRAVERGGKMPLGAS